MRATAPSGRAERCRSSPASARPRGCPTRTRTPGASACAGCSRRTSTARCRSSTTRRRRTRPPAAPEPMVSWVAFPATLRAHVPSQRERWKLADGDRGLQDEYCEWSVDAQRARARSRSVTFTTELPEYCEHLFETAPARLLRLYRKLVDPRVELARPAQRRRQLQAREPLEHVASRAAGAPEPGQQQPRRRDRPRRAGDGPAGRRRRRPGHQPAGARALRRPRRPAAQQRPADRLGGQRRRRRGRRDHARRPARPAPRPAADRRDGHARRRRRRALLEDRARRRRAHAARALRGARSSAATSSATSRSAGAPIKFGGQVADRVQVWVKVVVKPGNHTPKPQPCGT